MFPSSLRPLSAAYMSKSGPHTLSSLESYHGFETEEKRTDALGRRFAVADNKDFPRLFGSHLITTYCMFCILLGVLQMDGARVAVTQ